jgi:hypothetical protein
MLAVLARTAWSGLLELRLTIDRYDAAAKPMQRAVDQGREG